MKTTILLLLLNIASMLNGEEIKAGKYLIELRVPGMVKGQDVVTLSGKVKTDEKGFTFDTVGAAGNAVVLNGKTTDTGLVMWVSAEEHGRLVTFHFTGTFDNANGGVASGSVSIFQNHDKAAGGKWILKEQAKQEKKNGEQPGAAQPATKPADKAPEEGQPATPTSKDSPR